jgi:glycosyltransferase involved in cell wall biosynthesis
MHPDISLLIPCYNAAEFLPTLLTQARQQTRAFSEILVYDDGSTDDSASVAEQLGARVLRGQQSRGPGFARNQLLRESSSQWIHFHDADDWLRPEFVEKMGQLLKGPLYGAVCALEIVWQAGFESNRIDRFPDVEQPEHLVRTMIQQFIHFNALVLPKNLVSAVGGFVGQMRMSEDRDLLTRLAETEIRFGYLDEALATWVRRPSSLTRSRHELAQAPYRRWYLHRCYRKLKPEHRSLVGDQALYVGWTFYLKARGQDREAYRREARWWFYLAGLCGVQSRLESSALEKLLASRFGVEPVFLLKRLYAEVRVLLSGLRDITHMSRSQNLGNMLGCSRNHYGFKLSGWSGLSWSGEHSMKCINGLTLSSHAC